MDLSTKQKKEIVRAIYEEGWMKQEFDTFEDYISDQVDFNFRGAKNKVGSSELKHLIAHWRSVFPDLYYDLHQVICEGNIVAVNMTISGTQTSEWEGIPSIGNRFEVDEMMFFRFENNVIVEIWEVYDEKLLHKQLKSA